MEYTPEERGERIIRACPGKNARTIQWAAKRINLARIQRKSGA